MEQCQKAVCVQEENFPTPYVFRCLKHVGHSGDHYALDPNFQWVLRKIDGNKIIWKGRAEFLWNPPEVHVFEGTKSKVGMVLEVGEEPEIRKPALKIWEYGNAN